MADFRIFRSIGALVAALAVVSAATVLSSRPTFAQTQPVEAGQQLVETLLSERKWKEAIDAATQHVEKAKADYGSTDARYGMALYTLGKAYDLAIELGEPRYRRAEQVLKQAIEILRVNPGPKAPDTATAIHRLADVYDSIGDPKAAYPLAREAYEIRKALAPESAETAQSLELVGVIDRSEKRFNEAEKNLIEALAIKRKAHGAKSPEVANTLYPLAGIAFDRQQMSDAMPRYMEIAEILEQNRGRGDIEAMLGNTYLQLADVMRKLERFDEAEGYFGKGIEVREKLNGKTSTTVAAAYEKYAQHMAARGNKDGAARLLATAVGIYQSQTPPLEARVANAMTNLAYVFADQQWLKEAETLHRDALEIRRKHDQPRAYQSLMSLGVVERSLGRFSAAEAALKEALAIINSQPRPNPAAIAGAQTVLAGIYSDLERHKEAEPLARAALDYRIKQFGANSDPVAVSHNTLGAVLRAQEKYDEAEVQYRRALEIRKTQYGADHQQVAGLLSNLGGLNRARKRYGEAESDYKQAIDIYTRKSGADSPVLTTSLLNLAIVYADQGRDNEALPLVERALRIRRANSSGPADPRVLTAVVQLADLYARTDNAAEAEKLLKQAVEARSSDNAEPDLQLALLFERLAELSRHSDSKDKLNQAGSLLDRSLKIRQKLQGPSHPATVGAQLGLAEIYRRLERFRDAEQLERRALELGKDSLKEVSVLFGTDRRLEQKPGSPATFGADAGNALSLGRYTVAIHRSQSWSAARADDKGEDSQPREETSESAKAVPREWVADNAASLVSTAVQRMRASREFRGESMIFVHGYNVKFDDAVRATAKLAWDIGFTGSVFLYSWPSRGTVLGYLRDRNSAESATRPFERFIEDVVAQTGSTRIHIIAHSMGNRTVLQAVDRLAAKPVAQRLKIGNVLLAHPDVDRGNFKQYLPSLVKLGGKVTLYASHSDWPLWLSGLIGGVSAGYISDKEGPIVEPGLVTVDISDASKKVFSLNHSAFAQNQRLLLDMRIILGKGEQQPDKRSDQFVARTLPDGKGTYWTYRNQAPVIVPAASTPQDKSKP